MRLSDMALFTLPEWRGLGEIAPGLIALALLVVPVAVIVVTIILSTKP